MWVVLEHPKKLQNRLWKSNMKIWLFKWFGYIVLLAIYKTCKIKIQGQDNFNQITNNNRPTMLCVWHGRMLYPIFYVIKKKLSIWTIASPYNDGEIIAQILKKWNFQVIKGSSNRRSKQVLEKIETIFKTDPQSIVAVTNDGPKGPRHVAKKGSLEIAKKYNVNIITVTGDSNKKWVFDSWDKFYLPKPFSTINIHIAPEYSYDQEVNLSSNVSEYMIQHEKIASKKYD